MPLNQNNSQRLGTELIPNPGMHRLILVLSDSTLDVVIASRVVENDVIYRHFPLGENMSPLDALKDIIYENPLLTSDFNSVDIIINNRRFFVMDSREVTDDEIRRRIDLLWPADRTGEQSVGLTSTLEEGKTTLVWAVGKALPAFLRRTWNNPRLHHRIGVTARYYALKNHLGNMGKIYARLSPRRLDILAYGRDGLLLVNSFDIDNSADNAAYFTLAVASNLEFDNESDRIFVGGDMTLRDELTHRLREFVPMVMPEIVPAGTAELGRLGIPYEALLTLLM